MKQSYIIILLSFMIIINQVFSAPTKRDVQGFSAISESRRGDVAIRRARDDKFSSTSILSLKVRYRYEYN